MASSPQDFVTAASVTSFTGASGAVWLLTNATRYLLRTASPWPALVWSLVASYLIASQGHLLADALGYFVALVNAALLFLTALGVQTATGGTEPKPPPPPKDGGAELHGKPKVPWRTRWL